ncbi:PHP domain-containing protein [Desulfogranum japonicum]|uniref:PHP domain-containing protein n=1 Tax=Desulfogranum japonicum TaxID=231447 RepID=UPI00041150A9|nr:PHP domain-containing protein [Desulfogranum japonicum]
MCIDLHTHSIFSDGSLQPEELVDLALHRGVRVLSLTDHDTVEGQADMIRYGSEKGLEIIPGIEVSACYGKNSVHILGYGIDFRSTELLTWLERLQDGREERNIKIVKSLQDAGIDINLQEVKEGSVQGLTGRPHIAQLLIEKRVVRNFDEAFRRYLGRGQPAWHKRFCYSAIDTIAMIHNLGGIAVIAHPGQLDPQGKTLPAILRELQLRGLDGVEVYYPSHSRKLKKKLLQLCQDINLVVTGGSDYHGETRPLHMMAGEQHNFCPPDELYAPILKKITEQRNKLS